MGPDSNFGSPNFISPKHLHSDFLRKNHSLTHDGWGEGDEWDKAFEYFTEAWIDVVLPRLEYRFRVGPVDWDNPPHLMKR